MKARKNPRHLFNDNNAAENIFIQRKYFVSKN